MTLTITASDTDGNGVTSGEFFQNYTVAWLGQPYDASTWWATSGLPIAFGTYAYSNSVKYMEGDEDTVAYWQIHQTSSFTTSSMALSAEVMFTFDQVTFSNEQYTTVYSDPGPASSLDPLAPSTDMYAYLKAMAYNYVGSTADDSFDFSSLWAWQVEIPVFTSGGVAHGGEGNDIFVAGSGPDELYGDAGDDDITGSSGDILDGGDGDDYIHGASGATMVGGKGTDRLSLDLTSVTSAIDLKLADQVSASVEIVPDTFIKGFESFSLALGQGDDRLDLSGMTISNWSADTSSYFSGWNGSDTVVIDSTTQGTVSIYDFEHVVADLSGVTGDIDARPAYIDFDGFFLSADAPSQIIFLSIAGGSGDDHLEGASGSDTLSGGDGDDYLSAGADDVLDGGDGDDYVLGGTGATMVGGAGTDRLSLALTDITSAIELRLADQVSASLEVVPGTFIKGFEGFSITLGQGDDQLDLSGMTISDWSSDTNSSFNGWTGNDTIIIDSATRGGITAYSFEHVVADLSEVTEAIEATENKLSYEGLSVSFATGSDSIASVSIAGGSGNDYLEGSSGSDTLSGGRGNDIIVGGKGDDVAAYSGNKSDYSWVSNSNGSWTITDNRSGTASEGKDTLLGIETLTFKDGSVSLVTNTAPILAHAIADRSVAEDKLWSFTVPSNTFTDADGDKLTYTAKLSSGAALPSWLHFNAATRTFSGTPPLNYNGSLSLRVTASDGAASAFDVFKLTVSPVNDAPSDISLSASVVKENVKAGTVIGTLSGTDPDAGDHLSFSLVRNPDGVFAIKSGKLVVATGADIDYESHTSYSITIRATDTGGLHRDETFTIKVTDVIDTLTGTSAANTLRGASGVDVIKGLGGNDVLYGNGGNDVLEGGAGIDRLFGGAGSDRFVFKAGDSGKTHATADTIYDFAGGDRIDLTGWDANTTKSGIQDFDFIGAKAFSKHSGELHFVKDKSDTWIEGDTNGDGKADFVIHLDDALALKATAFDL